MFNWELTPSSFIPEKFQIKHVNCSMKDSPAFSMYKVGRCLSCRKKIPEDLIKKRDFLNFITNL